MIVMTIIIIRAGFEVYFYEPDEDKTFICYHIINGTTNYAGGEFKNEDDCWYDLIDKKTKCLD